ncbi:hypothetical protein ACOSP7_009450 [Xanthoceras sorbifolium]
MQTRNGWWVSLLTRGVVPCWRLSFGESFEGLKAGFRNVVLESDSTTAVELISKKLSVNHPCFSIVRSCNLLIKGDWRCVVTHVYREANKVADSIASLGHSMGVGTDI